ncbi:hypothetical protein [Actinomadura nitritigenes]
MPSQFGVQGDRAPAVLGFSQRAADGATAADLRPVAELALAAWPASPTPP